MGQVLKGKDIKNQNPQESDLSMFRGDLTNEQYRQYEWSYIDENGKVQRMLYTIHNPCTLYYRKNGGTTHRILDSDGVVHVVPAPGRYGCVLRWKSNDDTDAVSF